MTVWINSIAIVALVVACIGVLSSSIFLLLSLLGAAKFHRESEEQRQFAYKSNQLPAVSVLKPVHGAEAPLKRPGRRARPTPPAYSFFRMSQVAANDILVTSDSDVEVQPNYLREVV